MVSKECTLRIFRCCDTIMTMDTKLLDNNKRKKIYSSKRKGQDFIVSELFFDESKPKRYVCRGRKMFYDLMFRLVGADKEECDRDIRYCAKHDGLCYVSYDNRNFEIRDVGFAEFYYMANQSPSNKEYNKIGIKRLKERENQHRTVMTTLTVHESDFPLAYVYIKERLYNKLSGEDRKGRNFHAVMLRALEEYIKTNFKTYIENGTFGQERFETNTSELFSDLGLDNSSDK